MNEIKIAIITPSGEAEYIIIDENDTFHSYYLNQYVKKHYLVPDGVDMNNANSMSLFLRDKGNAIFLNTTTYKDEIIKRHGRNGIIIIPDVVTEEQEKSLLELNEKLQNFDSLQIWHNFLSKNECSMTVRHTNSESKVLLPGFLEYYKEKQNVTKSK